MSHGTLLDQRIKATRPVSYLKGSKNRFRTSYPTVKFNIPETDRSRQWILYLYILTECHSYESYYIHPTKRIFADFSSAFDQEAANDNENCSKNPYSVYLTEKNITEGTFEIRVVLADLQSKRHTETPLIEFDTEESFQSVRKQSLRIDKDLSGFSGDLSNFHLACVLTRDYIKYGLCISALATTGYRQLDSNRHTRIVSTKNQSVRMEVDDLSETPHASRSRKNVRKTAATRTPREAGTSSITSVPFAFPDKDQLTAIETEYSLICLLTKADALYELGIASFKSRVSIKPYECLSEVVKAVSQKLIIIVSQSLSRHFVPLIHDLIQVIYIYILHSYDGYHVNKDDNYVQDKRYPKVRGSFIEQTMLISKLNDDLKQLSNIPLRQPVLIDPSQTNTNADFFVIAKQSSLLESLTGKEQEFMSYQLIIKAILESDSANPLNNLTASLKLYEFFSNESKEKLLWKTNDEFQQKYIPEKAINFYLTDRLLKNEVNTCFCTKNIQKTCKLWFFIRDLLSQLPADKEPITMYRGQHLTTDELQILKNNVGSLMTFTKFFSMSTSNIRAIHRSGQDQSHSQLESVVFQLTISGDSAGVRFSMVQQTYEEQIFLFAAGNVFSIESVEKLNNQVWCCKLCINSDDESVLAQLFQHYETKIGKSLTYVSLGVYLNEVGKEDLAIQYYNILLLVVTDTNTTSSIHNNLAIIYECKNDLPGARYHWNLASKIEESDNLKTPTPRFEPKSYIAMQDPVPGTSPIINYYNLACVYRLTDRSDEALEECEKALKLTTTAFDSVNIALVRSVMGSVYFSQEKYNDALTSFQMALDIALIHLPATDPLIDQCLNNIRVVKNRINEKQS